jgi:predicted nucleic-acid-binding Zn-ribbon protein
MAQDARKVIVLEKPLVCYVCGNDNFLQREIKMQTTGLTFFDLDFLNESSDGVVCNRCGYVHMFAARVHEWQ